MIKAALSVTRSSVLSSAVSGNASHAPTELGTSGSVFCTLATYGSANAANDNATATNPVTIPPDVRLTLQVPVVAPTGGTYGATLNCTPSTGGFSHGYVTLSAVQTATLSQSSFGRKRPDPGRLIAAASDGA
jgi:hypothetical protein